jgi:hypothetical protein
MELAICCFQNSLSLSQNPMTQFFLSLGWGLGVAFMTTMGMFCRSERRFSCYDRIIAALHNASNTHFNPLLKTLDNN